jgi:hypothetical protein
MLRKMAIALVAASVFTAPVLAQNNTLSGGSTNKPAAPPASESMDKTEKTDKSAENVEKPGKTGKHHHAARHHHPKTAKLNKPGTMTSKAHTRTGKVAKTESRRHGHAMTTKHAFGKAPKHMMSPSPH